MLYTPLRCRLTLATVLREAVGVSAEPEINRALERVEETIETAGYAFALPYVLVERGLMARLHGDNEAAALLLREAERTFREQGAQLRADRVAELL